MFRIQRVLVLAISIFNILIYSQSLVSLNNYEW